MYFARGLAVFMWFATCLGLPCQLGGKWDECECTRFAIDAGMVVCQHLNWSPTIPNVPNVTTAKFRMTSLKIMQSKVILVRGGTFLGQDITALDLSYNEINFINAEAFRGLENKVIQLNLNHNTLTSIPVSAFSDLHQLRYLWLQNNRLNHVESSMFQGLRMENLQFLYLDHNQIPFIPPRTFLDVPLDTLTLDHNLIRSVDASALPPTLRDFRLSHNSLNDIPFEALRQCENLEVLQLDANNISGISAAEELRFKGKNVTLNLSGNRIRVVGYAPLSNFPWLKRLDLSDNELVQIGADFFEGVTRLEVLDLSFNRIQSIDREAFKHVGSDIRLLNLDDNRLHRLPEALFYCKQLNILNLKSNRIHLLEPGLVKQFAPNLKEFHLSYNLLDKVPREALEGMERLETLDLSKNLIQELGKLAFGVISQQGNSLVSLNLAGNQINQILDAEAFVYMSSVAYLDLSYNNLEYIGQGAFSMLSGLERLFLQHNRLRTIPSTAMRQQKRLRNLVLDNNQISVILSDSFENLEHLERLSLRNNRISTLLSTSFPSKFLSRLGWLSLAGNEITALPRHAFNNLTHLETLLLDNNNLRELDTYSFQNLPKLERLSLTRNVLEQLNSFCMTNLPSLKGLQLSWNNLSDIQPNILIGTPALEELYLSHNRFASFRTDFLRDVKALRVLDLSSNALTSLDRVTDFRQSLERLFLQRNLFETVPDRQFANFKRLRVIDMSQNRLNLLRSETFAGSDQLVQILLRSNNLKSVPKNLFADQLKIEMVDLSENEISSIDEQAFGSDNVVKVSLAMNNLIEVPLGALRTVRLSLVELDLSDNKISALRRTDFEDLRGLQTLLLARNRIKTISINAFEEMPKLRVLDLANNPTELWHANAFSNLSYFLQELSLADTGLRAMPQMGEIGLKRLNLSGNHFSRLNGESFKPLTKLESLDLSRNYLMTIADDMMSVFANLKMLNLSFNPLGLLDSRYFSFMSRLEVLSLHHLPQLIQFDTTVFDSLQRLQELEFYDLPRMQPRLNVARSLRNLPSLRSLHVEIAQTSLTNQLHTLDFRLMKSLSISGSALETIDLHALQNLRGYSVRLSITHTNISELPFGFLQTFRYVTYLHLNLGYNKIVSWSPALHRDMPIVSKHGTILASLNLEGNPLHCDRHLYWVVRWFDYVKQTLPVEEYEDTVRRWERTVCTTPRRYSGKPVLEVVRQMGNGATRNLELSWISVGILHFAVFCMKLFSSYA